MIDKIKELSDKIMLAREAYYNTDCPIMSDQHFDSLIDELKKIDPNNVAILTIGCDNKKSHWVKKQHSIFMGSLCKVNTKDELNKWYDGSSILNISEKLDGISINCEYEAGNLVRALTRNNGSVGEDIFSNVVKMEGVKTHIQDFTGSLRGEIILRRSKYNKYFSDKANPRNAAAGIARRLDGKGAEHLTVMFYQVVSKTDFEHTKENKYFSWLNSYGMLVPGGLVSSNIEDVFKLYDKYQNGYRDTLDYDIDGLVVGYNDLDYKHSLGETNGRPKGAVAFKFDNVFVETDFKEILWQVGNSGRVTPVGVVNTVNLCGTDVSRSSLYNVAYIRSIGLTTEAKVLITKANEIIPRIEQVSVANGEPVTIPTHCPECGSELEMVGENLTCLNVATCPAQIVGRVKNWVSGLGLLEWGDTLVSRLVESGLVADVADLYTIKHEDLAGLERMGDRSAEKCLEILHSNTELSLDVLLGSLSITMNSKSTIKTLMSEGFSTLDDFLNATVDDFAATNGMGEIKSQYLVDGLKACKPLIEKLLANGISIKKKSVGTLTGYSFCFSGKFSMKRDQLEKMVSDRGGDAKKTASKGLDYLVLQDANSTSSKAKAARKNGIKIISEQEFLEMIE